MLPFLWGLPTYALCAALGCAVGIIVFLHRTPRALRRRTAVLICITAPGALLGAKLLYLHALPEGTPPPDTLLTGFVFHGGLIGGALAGLIGARLLRLPLLSLLDAAAPALALGHSIGRIGCFCAGCCHGIPVPPPLGLVLPHALAAPRDVPLLPVQLMEAAGLCALGLWLLRPVHPAREAGGTAARYCLVYAVMRFLLEFLRGDGIRGFSGALSTGQWLSIAVLASGLLLLMRTSRIVLTLHNTRLVIDNRLLGGLAPIRFTAHLLRTQEGRAELQLRLAGKKLSLSGSKRTQFHFLDALPELSLRVRRLTVQLSVGIPDDAALLTVTVGALRAGLNALGAALLARERTPPELSLQVEADDRSAHLRVKAQAVLAFDTADALRAVLRTLRRQRKRTS